MNLDSIAFAALGAVAVVTAATALLVRELVHTILWIATFFVALAGLYFLLNAPFLGVLQLGVYAGAVTILLLFGIMVTRKTIFSKEASTGLGPIPIALALFVVVLLAAVSADLYSASPAPALHGYDPSALSTTLFGSYGPYLLILGLVMLAALAGAIYLVREGRE